MAVQETATELGTNQWVWLHAAKAVSCKNIPWASQAALGVLWSNSIKAIAVLQWICATETWLWSGHKVRLSGKKRKKVLGVKTIKGKAPGTFCTGSEYSRPASAWGLYCTYSYRAAGAGSRSEPEQGAMLTRLLARETNHPHLIVWIFSRTCQHQPRWLRQYVTPFPGHTVFILSCLGKYTQISKFYIGYYLNIMRY